MKSKIHGVESSSFITSFCRFWVKLLVFFIDFLLTTVIVVGVSVYIFPLLSSFAVESMGLPDVASIEAYILIFSCVACFAVVAGSGVVFLLKKIYARSFSVYDSLCNKFKLTRKETNAMGKASGFVPRSKFGKAVAVFTSFAIVGGLVFCIHQMGKSGETGSLATGSEVSATLLPTVREYPSITDTDAGASLDAVNLSDWSETDTESALDAIASSINDFASGSAYSSRVRIGMDSSNPASDGAVLFRYIQADMNPDLTLFVPGGSFEYGDCLYLDSTYANIPGEDAASSVWRTSYKTYGTKFAVDDIFTIYADGNMFTSSPDISDGAKPYTYSESDGSGYLDACTFEFLEAMFMNISVPVNDITMYFRENAFGTSYYYESSIDSVISGYDSLTKRVLFDCVGDGEYVLEIDYVVAKGDEEARFVFDIDLDTTDIQIDVPSVDDALYVVPKK